MHPSLRIPALFALLLFLPLSPRAGAERPVRTLGEKIRNGRLLFDTNGCSTCHTMLGRGGKVGPDLSRTAGWASPLLGAAVMWNHVPLMKKAMAEKGLSWPEFKGEEATDIFTYLHSLSRKEGGDYALRGKASLGKAVFMISGCVICHAKPFRGGNVGPDLGRRAAKIRTEAEFATRMLRHATHMVEKAKSLEIEWPQLTGSEMAHIFAYLKSLRKGKK
ncbi:MAG: cytochrome c [bacterium]